MTTALAEVPTLSLDDLPAELRDSLEALQEALTKSVPAEWPGDSKYVNAVQPEAIALALKQAGLHDSLSNARIVYLFRKEWETKGKPTLGKLGRAEGKFEFIAKVNFVVEINWSVYKDLTSQQKLAAIDHLLSYGYRDLETGAWKIARPDVEEFIPVIGRWGFWQPDLKLLGKTIQQLKLL